MEYYSIASKWTNEIIDMSRGLLLLYTRIGNLFIEDVDLDIKRAGRDGSFSSHA